VQFLYLICRLLTSQLNFPLTWHHQCKSAVLVYTAGDKIPVLGTIERGIYHVEFAFIEIKILVLKFAVLQYYVNFCDEHKSSSPQIEKISIQSRTLTHARKRLYGIIFVPKRQSLCKHILMGFLFFSSV